MSIRPGEAEAGFSGAKKTLVVSRRIEQGGASDIPDSAVF